MKKIKIAFIIFVLSITGTSAFAQTKIDVDPVTNGPGHNNGSGSHRTPARIPDIYINGNTLSFDDSCIGCTLVLYQDNQVVFTATVSDSAEIQLPTTLSGNLTLEITVGSIVFIGEIQL